MSTNFESLEKLINETEKERDKRAMAQLREMTEVARAKLEEATEAWAEGVRAENQKLKNQMEADIMAAQEEAAKKVKAKYAEAYGRKEWTGDFYQSTEMKDFLNGLLSK